MLFASLFFSLLLLLVAIRLAYRSSTPIRSLALVALGFALAPYLLMLVFPAVLLQSVLLLVAMIGCSTSQLPRRAFVQASLFATVMPYCVVGWFAFRHTVALREKYPYVSLEDRLAPPTQRSGSAMPPRLANANLVAIEELIENKVDPWVSRERVKTLKQLHEDAIIAFASQSGFGVTRMNRFSDWRLTHGLRQGQPVAQPSHRAGSSWPDWDARDYSSEPGADVSLKELLEMHAHGVVDFVHPGGFGFFKDRERVAGFQEHQFSELPEAVTSWGLQKLDLLGLVVHGEPLVYVSENLPRMNELRKAATRKPDNFEEAGLKSLRSGEDLFVRNTASHMRVLGAIRSAKQCVECHGGQRGDLLGAFSYTFARTGK